MQLSGFFFVRKSYQRIGFIITAGVSILPVLLCICSDRGCVSCSIVCQPVRVRSAPIACLTDAEGQQPSEASKAVHFRVCPPGFPRRQTWAKGYPLRVFILKNRKNDHPLLIGGLTIISKMPRKPCFTACYPCRCRVAVA